MPPMPPRKTVAIIVSVICAILLAIGITVYVTSHGNGTDSADIDAASLDHIHDGSSLSFGQRDAHTVVDVVIEPQCPACHTLLQDMNNKKNHHAVSTGTMRINIYPLTFLSKDGLSEKIIAGWMAFYAKDTSTYKSDSLSYIMNTITKLTPGYASPGNVADVMGIPESDIENIPLSDIEHVTSLGMQLIHHAPPERQSTPLVLIDGHIVSNDNDLALII